MIFEGTYRSGKIWHARVVAGDRMMPVRIEFDTAFGIVMGHLAELPGRGSDLHLARESHGAVPMRVSSTSAITRMTGIRAEGCIPSPLSVATFP